MQKFKVHCIYFIIKHFVYFLSKSKTKCYKILHSLKFVKYTNAHQKRELKCETFEFLFVKHAFYFIHINFYDYSSVPVQDWIFYPSYHYKWKFHFLTTINHSTSPRQYYAIEFCLRKEALNKCIASFGGFSVLLLEFQL